MIYGKRLQFKKATLINQVKVPRSAGELYLRPRLLQNPSEEDIGRVDSALGVDLDKLGGG